MSKHMYLITHFIYFLKCDISSISEKTELSPSALTTPFYSSGPAPVQQGLDRAGPREQGPETSPRPVRLFGEGHQDPQLREGAAFADLHPAEKNFTAFNLHFTSCLLTRGVRVCAAHGRTPGDARGFLFC